MHRDSVGSEQPIRPGEVNWMTAGRGITHSERFEGSRREGDVMNGMQAWVALPRENEETDPAFAHYDGSALPEFAKAASGLGSSPAKRSARRPRCKTHSPLFYVHWELDAGAEVRLPAATPSARLTSSAARSRSTASVRCRAACSCSSAAPSMFRALGRRSVMLLGGEPVGERYIEWNFVSSSRERIGRRRQTGAPAHEAAATSITMSLLSFMV